MRKIPYVIFLLIANFCQAGDLQQLVSKINHERTSRHLSPLKVSKELSAAANEHAAWMAKTNQFTHLEGSKPEDIDGWKISSWHPINRAVKSHYLNFEILNKPNANDHVSEVIAHGEPTSGKRRFNPTVIVSGWMHSPGHRECLLGNYKDVGAAKSRTKQGDIFWVVVFGTKE